MIRVGARAQTRHARGVSSPPSPRSRVFRWSDPVAAAAQAEGRAGLEYLQGIARGDIPQPPLGLALGFALVEVAPGYAVFTAQAAEYHYNLIGTVHGGFPAALIDSASGCAVMSALAPGDRWTTIQLSVDVLRGVTPASGLLRCVGRTVRVGGRIALADAELRDEAGALLVRGATTCLITRGAADGRGASTTMP